MYASKRNIESPTRNVITPVNTKNCADDTIFPESLASVVRSILFTVACEFLHDCVILNCVLARLG